MLIAVDGSYKDGRVGIGIVIETQNVTLHRGLEITNQLDYKERNNTTAELMAVIVALELASKLEKDTEVTILYDYSVSFSLALGLAKAKTKTTRMYKDRFNKLSKLFNKINFVKVRAHRINDKNHKLNSIADALAKNAIGGENVQESI